MTRTELISYVLYGIRTGQIVAWLDSDGEIRMITAEQATAAHWRMRLGAAEVIAMAHEFQRVFKTRTKKA